MNLTTTIVISVVAYVLGAITKIFVYKIPNRFIPVQNVIVGIVSGLICYFAKIEPNVLTALFSCIIATMGAGGLSDLVSSVKNKED